MNLKIFTTNIEQTALDQIHTLCSQPAFKDCKIRIMPDVHAGAGCVIGFTADLGDKVIPNIVGVDIGCGMLTIELGQVDIDYQQLDDVIRANVPSGMNVNTEVKQDFPIEDLYCFSRLRETDWIRQSMGSLGGGNHFIEIDADQDGNKYLVIHTGSRNLGKQVADLYQKMAIDQFYGRASKQDKIAETIAKLKAEGREREISSALAAIKQEVASATIPKELCYLTGEQRLQYLHDMKLCQEFAVLNRATIAQTILEAMRWTALSSFETIHNYIDHDSNIVRKGAISAKAGERLLIPMNMRDGCIVGIGKGNEDWNCSAPHGAGRILSRAAARKQIDMAAYKATMSEIWTTSVCFETIDESPMAYKPMDEIIAAIEPTVEIEKIIKPVYNFKASE